MEDKSALKKIKQLTTNLGVYQFGSLDQSDPSFGYALDDQVRALIVADEYGEENLKKIYLNYIIRSRRSDNLLYQFSDKNGKMLDNNTLADTEASQEAYGETIWAIYKTNSQDHPEIKPIINQLLQDAEDWKYLRSTSQALLGITCCSQQTPLEKKLIEKLIRISESNFSQDWYWPENILSYANAIIPWSLWQVAIRRHDKKAWEIAQKTTIFLLNVCQENGIPAPIGTQGWYQRGGQKALYDQQPIDVGYIVCCLEKAFLATNDQYYFSWAYKWWQWFWGGNTKSSSLIDEGLACSDGLTKYGPSLNQGAESNICFLMAYQAIKRMNLLNFK